MRSGAGGLNGYLIEYRKSHSSPRAWRACWGGLRPEQREYDLSIEDIRTALAFASAFGYQARHEVSAGC